MKNKLLISTILFSSISLIGCSDDGVDSTVAGFFSAYNLNDYSEIKLSYSEKNYKEDYPETSRYKADYRESIEFDNGKSVSLTNDEHIVGINFKGFDSEKFIVEDMYFTSWDHGNILSITPKKITLKALNSDNFVLNLHKIDEFSDYFLENNFRAKLHIYTSTNVFTFNLSEPVSYSRHEGNGKHKEDYEIENTSSIDQDSDFNFKYLEYSSSLIVNKARGVGKLFEIKAEKYNVLTYIDFKYSLVACCKFDMIEGYVYSAAKEDKRHIAMTPISFSGDGDYIDISFLNRKYFVDHEYEVSLAITVEEGYKYISICSPQKGILFN